MGLLIFMLILGLLAHALSQIVKARKVNKDVTPINYFTENGLETLLAAVFAVAAFVFLPEAAEAFPDLFKAFGIQPHLTAMNAFIIGFASNLIADFFGSRFNNISVPPGAGGG